MVLGEDDIEESLAEFGSVLFENVRFGGFESHVMEIDSEGGFERVLMEEGGIFGDGFECFLVFIMMEGVLVIMIIVVMRAVFSVIVIIVIIAVMEVILKNKPFKVVILITGRFFGLAISVVVVVVLVIEPSELVEKIYVVGRLYPKPFSIDELCEHLEPGRVW